MPDCDKLPRELWELYGRVMTDLIIPTLGSRKEIMGQMRHEANRAAVLKAEHPDISQRIRASAEAALRRAGQ